MKKLIIILLAGIFLAGCAGLDSLSPEEYRKNREEYKQWQRDKVQRDILKELKERNRNK